MSAGDTYQLTDWPSAIRRLELLAASCSTEPMDDPRRRRVEAHAARQLLQSVISWAERRLERGPVVEKPYADALLAWLKEVTRPLCGGPSRPALGGEEVMTILLAAAEVLRHLESTARAWPAEEFRLERTATLLDALAHLLTHPSDRTPLAEYSRAAADVLEGTRRWLEQSSGMTGLVPQLSGSEDKAALGSQAKAVADLLWLISLCRDAAAAPAAPGGRLPARLLRYRGMETPAAAPEQPTGAKDGESARGDGGQTSSERHARRPRRHDRGSEPSRRPPRGDRVRR